MPGVPRRDGELFLRAPGAGLCGEREDGRAACAGARGHLPSGCRPHAGAGLRSGAGRLGPSLGSPQSTAPFHHGKFQSFPSQTHSPWRREQRRHASNGAVVKVNSPKGFARLSQSASVPRLFLRACAETLIRCVCSCHCVWRMVVALHTHVYSFLVTEFLMFSGVSGHLENARIPQRFLQLASGNVLCIFGKVSCF